MLYITYVQNGQKKKATVSQDQYMAMQKNPQISNITIHPNQADMDKSFGESMGQDVDKRGLLKG